MVSHNEKDRLHAMLLRAKGMTAAHLAELAEAIKQAEFAKPDEDALLDVISELAIQSSPSIAILPTRTALQDWQSLCNYFPASCWEARRCYRFPLALGLAQSHGVDDEGPRAVDIVCAVLH